jgi:hypothetical protein
VASLHDAGNRLQGAQNFFLRSFQDNHFNLSTWS